MVRINQNNKFMCQETKTVSWKTHQRYDIDPCDVPAALWSTIITKTSNVTALILSTEDKCTLYTLTLQILSAPQFLCEPNSKSYERRKWLNDSKSTA